MMIMIILYNTTGPRLPGERAPDRARDEPVAGHLEGTKGVPRNGGRE